MTETAYSSQQASELTGVTMRQLAYWRRTALLPPSDITAGGHARYTFIDLVALKAIRTLLDGGVSIQRIRGIIRALQDQLPHLKTPLSEASLVVTGDVVLVFRDNAAFEALSGQAWLLPVAHLQRDIERWRKRRLPPPEPGPLAALNTQQLETVVMTSL
ncbi:MAG: MerR family transcriptional regulator [Gammaproteobacteria bacterium]|nr:MerR family transcriptional regulator [Gammaproteobacteria bacterium]